MALPFDETGAGPPVVLVHGAAPPMAWGELPEQLATSQQVITYGRRGFPPNEHHGLAASLRQHADDLEGILEEVGPATVIGWSSGAVVALDLALREPSLVPRLVVLEAPLHAKRRPSPGQVRAVVGAQLKARRDPERGARHFLAWALGRTDGRPGDLLRLDRDDLRDAAPAIVHETTQGTGEREIARKDLADLAVETSWLVGTASVPGMRRAAERAARRSRRITITEVPGAGHAIALDAPEVIAAAATSGRRSTSER